MTLPAETRAGKFHLLARKTLDAPGVSEKPVAIISSMAVTHTRARCGVPVKRSSHGEYVHLARPKRAAVFADATNVTANEPFLIANFGKFSPRRFPFELSREQKNRNVWRMAIDCPFAELAVCLSGRARSRISQRSTSELDVVVALLTTILRLRGDDL